MSIKGTAVISLTDLRELLADPDTQKNARQLHFRFLLNGRVLREFRSFTVSRHQLMPVDLTWLIGELRHAGDKAIDLRVEVTPES